MIIRSIMTAALLSIACVSAGAKTFRACHETPGTNAATCIDEDAIRVNGEVRAAPIWRGGPNGVSKTPYVLVTNCAKGITTAQDSDGVNFGGAMTAEMPASFLANTMCNASKIRKDPKLRQF
jgi:hypothetical protein